MVRLNFKFGMLSRRLGVVGSLGEARRGPSVTVTDG
jgi:hypothetical protein